MTPTRSFTRSVLTAVTTGLLLLALFLALLWAGQRRLIYLPYGAVDPPASLGLAGAEPFAVRTTDGVTIRGWYIPAATAPALDAAPTANSSPSARAVPSPADSASTRSRGAAAGSNARPFTVIVFPGNAGNRSHRAPLAAALAQRGVATVLFDYRGYGDSEGRPSEEGLALDAARVRDYVATHPEVDASRLVYFGESLGAAVALRLALDHPPLALVLRSPFTSLADVGRAAYPFLPVGLLLREYYPSLDRIPRLTSPLLVITGDHDEVIPVAQSERLYAAATVPKRLLRIGVRGHNALELLAGRELVEGIIDFVSAMPSMPRGER